MPCGTDAHMPFVVRGLSEAPCSRGILAGQLAGALGWMQELCTLGKEGKKLHHAHLHTCKGSDKKVQVAWQGTTYT